MNDSGVLYDVTDGICTITLDRPRARNALGDAGLRALSEAWTRFASDKEARVAILTGAGDKAFCAGVDLKGVALDEGDESFVAQFVKWGVIGDVKLFPRQLYLGKPVIAALNGPAIGLGAVLALQSDIRIATENASIGYGVVSRGMFPPYLHELWLAAPHSMALQSLFTDEPISAKDAYRVGLYSEMVDGGQLVARARSIAERIRDNPPLVMAAIKRVWETQPQHAAPWAVHVYHDNARRIEHSSDSKEGVNAFIEKRPPIYRGK
jgi:enoyl-CoA hydratase/carnithine racemase